MVINISGIVQNMQGVALDKHALGNEKEPILWCQG